MSELDSKPPIFIQAYSEALRSKVADHTQGGAMENHDFKEHFSSLLTESEEHLSTLDQFLAERLEQAEINDPQTVIASIDAVLDSIDRNHENLTASKQNGTSRTAWLQQNLTEQTSSLKENQAATLIDTITDSMTGETSAAVDENGSFSGLDAVEKVRNLDQALIETTCQAQTELQNAVLSTPDDTTRESKLMQRAIEGKDPVAFKQIRKIATVCLMTMDSEKQLDYASASIMADQGIFALQTDYAVGSGECNEADAVEQLIDRGAAQLYTWVEKAVPHVIEFGITAVAAFATTHCPVAFPLVKKVAPVVKSMCQKAAHPILRKGAEKIQTAIKGVWQRLKRSNGMLGKIANSITSVLTAK